MATHVIFGSTAFVLLAVKFALIRFRRERAYDLAPRLGRVIAVCLASGLAYLSGNL